MLEKMFKLTTEAGHYIIKEHDDCPETWISVDYFEGDTWIKQLSITKEDATLLGKVLIDISKEN